jgi:hypothetical protein
MTLLPADPSHPMATELLHGQQEAGLRLDLANGSLDIFQSSAARSPDSIASGSDEGTATTQGLEDQEEYEYDEEGRLNYDLLTPPSRKAKACSDGFLKPIPVPVHSHFCEPDGAMEESRHEWTNSILSMQDELQV